VFEEAILKETSVKVSLLEFRHLERTLSLSKDQAQVADAEKFPSFPSFPSCTWERTC